MTQTRWPTSDRSARWPACGKAPRAPTSTRWRRDSRRTCSSSTTRLQPIDRQTNGPQLFYGLRYHTHITKPGEAETFHDQVGYWLWEPAAQQRDPHPRYPARPGAAGLGPGRARRHRLRAHRHRRDPRSTASCPTPSSTRPSAPSATGSTSPSDADGTWSYEEEGVLQIPGRDEPFSHIDRNTLTRVGPPEPNPLARAAQARHGRRQRRGQPRHRLVACRWPYSLRLRASAGISAGSAPAQPLAEPVELDDEPVELPSRALMA